MLCCRGGGLGRRDELKMWKEDLHIEQELTSRSGNAPVYRTGLPHKRTRGPTWSKWFDPRLHSDLLLCSHLK